MMTQTRPDWLPWALGVAESVAERADCTRRKVGAVILDRDHRIVGAGYNGAPPGLRGCLEGACPRGRHYEKTVHAPYPEVALGAIRVECGCGGPWPCPGAAAPGSEYSDCLSLHAEVNACIDAGRKAARYGTIVVTDVPCNWCVKVIQAAGILRVAFPENGRLTVLDYPFYS